MRNSKYGHNMHICVTTELYQFGIAFDGIGAFASSIDQLVPMYLSMSVVMGTAPMTLSFFSPSLKMRTVGMLRMPHWDDTSGLSPVFTLQHLILPAYTLASSSITGAIIRQGPHQGAQNSTSTGVSHPITISSQFASVASRIAHHAPSSTPQVKLL
jgi:hypothetical protein